MTSSAGFGDVVIKRIWQRTLGACVISCAVAASGFMSLAQAPATGLDIAAKSVVAAPRGDRLIILLDLQAHRERLKSLAEAEAVALVSATGQRYAAELLNTDRFRDKFSNIDVIFSFVESMDEYNRPNYGGMTRLGTMVLRRADGKLEVVSSQIDGAQIRK